MKKCISLQLFLVFCLLFSACGPAEVTPIPQAGSAAPQPMITFRLALLSPLPAGESISLVILDEISGLPFNRQVIPMQAEDSQHFISIQPFPMNSQVKYRYMRSSSSYSAQEFTAAGEAVRYRLLQVDGPGVYQDIVSRWADSAFAGQTGRVRGQILSQSEQALGDILIFAGGAQTLTDANGFFSLEGLPPGTHTLVAYAQDGSFVPAQQGVTVAAEAETPVLLRLAPRQMVNLVFVVSLPADTPANATVRLAGGLSQLGNSFANLSGEISGLAVNMPAMKRLPDGRYTATVALPAGAAVEYRYTLGDGLWNTEHRQQAAFNNRWITVPNSGGLIEDTVATWRYGNIEPIHFQVRLNAPLVSGEQLYIQFNPGYGWTEAIPLWPLDGQWEYVLFGPLVGVQTLQYRYCRNGQCGSADDLLTAGPLAAGRQVVPGAQAQTLNDSVDGWAWMAEPLRPAVVPSLEILSRGSGFVAGIEYQTGYHASWAAQLDYSLQEAAQLSPNWLILTPQWRWTRQSPPALQPLAALEMSSRDLAAAAAKTQQMGLQAAVFPQMDFQQASNAWWQNSRRDFAWWVSWFEAYRVYALHFARLAAQNNAGLLILGGEGLAPAMPGGLIDGAASGAPADAEERWRAILAEVRAVYSGPLYWALPVPLEQSLPPFLDAVDGLYILWSPRLSDQATTDLDLLTRSTGSLLDSQVLPLQQQTARPLILAVAYPSASGGVTGSLALRQLQRPNPDSVEITLNLNEQEAAYNALFLALNQRTWLSGVVTRGFYPPLQLQDKSASVHGKPAGGSIWYWFGKFLGK